MTGAELMNRVRSAIGNRTDKEVEILQAVNDGIVRVASLHRWNINQETDETVTLVTDQELYSLPERTTAVVSLFLENQDAEFLMLTAVSITRFDQVFKARFGATLYDMTGMTGDHTNGDPAYFLENRTGEPNLYAHFGGKIVVYPVPTAAQDGLKLHIRLTKRPEPISSQGVNPLGEELDRVVAAFATADVCAILTLWNDSKGWEGRAHMLLREAITEERSRPDWTPRTTVRGRSMIP